MQKLCARCRRIIEYPATHCEACAATVADEREASKVKIDARYNRKRDPKYATFYHSPEWQALRRHKLQLVSYRCEECGKSLATEVHHVVPVGVDWDKRFDADNLRALCTRCHNAAHERFAPRGRGKKFSPSRGNGAGE